MTFIAVRLASIAILLASSCVDTPPMAEPVVESSHVEIREIPGGPVSKLDVLIFVDDTAATAAYREQIGTVPALLARSIDALAGGWRDVRIAVTSNDATLRTLPGTNSSVIVDARNYDYTHWTNYSGSLADALAPLITVGTSDGPSRPLEAMRRTLELNSQFLRDDAELAVLIISGADDASPWPTDDYLRWLDAASGAPWFRRVVGIGIYPQGAARLDAYFTRMQRAAKTSPDSDKLAQTLQAIQNVDWGGWGAPCMEAEPIALDATHFDCGMAMSIEGDLRSIPQCEPLAIAAPSDSTSAIIEPSPACWSLQRDPQNCWQNGYVIRLRGYTFAHHPPIRFECVTR